MGAALADGIFRQREIVRRGLSGHPDASGFGISDGPHGTRRADMGDMNGSAG